MYIALEHCVRDAGVEGSNPFTPTIFLEFVANFWPIWKNKPGSENMDYCKKETFKQITLKITPCLRWYYPNGINGPKILQQMWQSEDDHIEWLEPCEQIGE